MNVLIKAKVNADTAYQNWERTRDPKYLDAWIDADRVLIEAEDRLIKEANQHFVVEGTLLMLFAVIGLLTMLAFGV